MPKKERAAKAAAHAMNKELDSEMTEEEAARKEKAGMPMCGRCPLIAGRVGFVSTDCAAYDPHEAGDAEALAAFAADAPPAEKAEASKYRAERVPAAADDGRSGGTEPRFLATGAASRTAVGTGDAWRIVPDARGPRSPAEAATTPICAGGVGGIVGGGIGGGGGGSLPRDATFAASMPAALGSSAVHGGHHQARAVEWATASTAGVSSPLSRFHSLALNGPPRACPLCPPPATTHLTSLTNLTTLSGLGGAMCFVGLTAAALVVIGLVIRRTGGRAPSRHSERPWRQRPSMSAMAWHLAVPAAWVRWVMARSERDDDGWSLPPWLLPSHGAGSRSIDGPDGYEARYEGPRVGRMLAGLRSADDSIDEDEEDTGSIAGSDHCLLSDAERGPHKPSKLAAF